VPNCRAYDPAFAYEVAIIVDQGMRQMIEHQEDVFYYLTVTNENYPQPSIAESATVREGVLKGMYALDPSSHATAQIQLLGSGAILGEVLAAARMLKEDWNVDAAIWSVTSFSELHRDGAAVERTQRLFEDGSNVAPYVTATLGATNGPVIAATDYVRAVPELIRAYIPRRYVTLGTDGFGRSDSRAALREFFEVDRASIALAALKALVDEGAVEGQILREAIGKYGKGGSSRSAPWKR
jgi:pyruvate dehydrogenase E1 component